MMKDVRGGGQGDNADELYGSTKIKAGGEPEGRGGCPWNLIPLTQARFGNLTFLHVPEQSERER